MADKFRKAGSNLRKGVKAMIKESREVINNLKKKNSQEKGEDKSKDPESNDVDSDDSSDEIEDIGIVAANLMAETKKLTLELRKLEQEYDKQLEDKKRIKKEKEDLEDKYKVISRAYIDAVRIIDEFATGIRKSGSDQLLDFNEDMSKACVSLMKTVYDQHDNELMSNCILKYCTEVPTSPRASVQISSESSRPKSTEVKSPAKIASPRATVTFSEPVVPKEDPVEENHEELIVSIFQGLQNESLSPRNSANVTPVKPASSVTPSNTSTPTTKADTNTSTFEVSNVKSEPKTSPRAHTQSTNDAVKPSTASPKPTDQLTKKSSWTTTRPKSVAIESTVVNATILSNKRMSGAVDTKEGTISSPLHPTPTATPTAATLNTPTQQSKPYSAPTSPAQPSTTTVNTTVSSSLPTSPAGPSNVKAAVQTANAKSRANPTPPPSNPKREPPRLSQVIPNYRPPKKTPTTNPPTTSSPSHASTTPQAATNSPSHSSALDKLLSPLTNQPASPSSTNNNTAANTPTKNLNLGSNPSTPTNKVSAVQSAVANIEKTSPRATGPTSPRTSVSSGNNPTSPRNSVTPTPATKTR